MFSPPLADIPFPLIIITYTTRCVETFDKENLSCRQRFNNEIIARKGKKKKKTRDDLTVKKRKKERNIDESARFPSIVRKARKISARPTISLLGRKEDRSNERDYRGTSTHRLGSGKAVTRHRGINLRCRKEGKRGGDDTCPVFPWNFPLLLLPPLPS